MIETILSLSGQIDALRAVFKDRTGGTYPSASERTLDRLASLLVDVAELETADMAPGAIVTVEIRRQPVPYPGGPLAIYGNVYVQPAPVTMSVAPVEPTEGAIPPSGIQST